MVEKSFAYKFEFNKIFELIVNYKEEFCQYLKVHQLQGRRKRGGGGEAGGRQSDTNTKSKKNTR